jgi:ABC-2 type transport system permease protein
MPLKSSQIVLARLSGVFAVGLMYELVIMVPTVVLWFQNASIGAAGVVFTLLVTLLLAVIGTSLAAALGCLVALLSRRMRNKSAITVLLSLGFFVVYYYACGHISGALQSILLHPDEVGTRVHSVLYPLYCMGRAAEGDLRSMLIFAALAAVLFGVVYSVLTRSFLHIATENRGAVKVEYKEKRVVVRSLQGALFHKELSRFLSSATYMLNCGMGVVAMPVVAVVAVWQRELLREAQQELGAGQEGLLALLVALIVCTLACTNDTSAVSVSLEGKNIWLAQSLPVPAEQALLAKWRLQMVLTIVPSAVLLAALDWVLSFSGMWATLIGLTTASFITFMACFGLCINLKTPNLTWTSETVPIKQSVGVMVAMFGGWVILAALAGGYYLLQKVVLAAALPAVYLACVATVLFVAAVGMLVWIHLRGAKIFEEL